MEIEKWATFNIGNAKKSGVVIKLNSKTAIIRIAEFRKTLLGTFHNFNGTVKIHIKKNNLRIYPENVRPVIHGTTIKDKILTHFESGHSKFECIHLYRMLTGKEVKHCKLMVEMILPANKKKG